MLSQSARRIPYAAAISRLDVTPLVGYGRTPEESGDTAENTDDVSSRLRRAHLSHLFDVFPEGHRPWFASGAATQRPSRLCSVPSGGKLYLAEDINLSLIVN